MTAVSVVQRPGGALLVSGLLAASEDVVDVLAALLVDEEARELAGVVARLGVERMDAPIGGVVDGAYVDAVAALGRRLAAEVVRLTPCELAPIADAVITAEADRLVAA